MFTPQLHDSYIKLLDYGSRRYDPELGRFIQPDSIVPVASQGVQAWDRFAYTNNNPVKYNDPSGHDAYWCQSADCTNSYYSTWNKNLRSVKYNIFSRQAWRAYMPGETVQMLQNPDYDEGFWPEHNWGYQRYSEAYPDMSLSDRLDKIAIHYEGDLSVLDNSFTDGNAVKELQEGAMRNGLTDIQYHFIIGPDGSIYEGRDIGVRGTHIDEGNTGVIGILWLGVSNSRGGIPTEEQFQTTVDLITLLDNQYGIDYLGGHNDYDQTPCPGENAQPYIDMLKSIFP